MNINYHGSTKPIASWSNSDRDAFSHGEWKIDCPLIEFRQRKSDEPLIFSGPGTIFQDMKQQLRIKIYSSEEEKSKGLLHLYNIGDSGQLLGEEQYFDVSTVDAIGRHWNSERHLLKDCTISTNGHLIIELGVEELWCEENLHNNEKKALSYGLNFTVFDNFDFPLNTTKSTTLEIGGEVRSTKSGYVWQFEAAGCDFELGNYESFNEIRVNSPFANWDNEFPERVLDSLFFALGMPILPSERLLYRDNIVRRTIYSRRSALLGARHRRPFVENHPTQPCEILVDSYLRFVLIHENPRFIWAQINAVYEASAARFIDAWALTLSVVIESFVNTEFESLAQPEPLEKALVDEAIDLLKNWVPSERFSSISERFKARAKGSLSGIKSARINDRLRFLEGQGVICQGATKAWTEIRNGMAHSYQAGRMRDDKLRKHLSTLETLFYQLLFHAIHYQGLFTDFSADGWPSKTYPTDVINERLNETS